MSEKRYIPRQISALVLSHAQEYPVVAIMGPRQAGKTSLVKALFPDKAYINLENLALKRLIEADPKGFLNNYPDGAIIDEIQNLPDLLSYIQVRVDANQRVGEFILTGSHQLMLHEAITQSLAGRVSLLTLLPFNFEELSHCDKDLSLNQLLWKGFYPRVHEYNMDPVNAYRNYYQTYVERDVRKITAVKDLTQFDHFVRILASRVGQLLNLQSIGNDLGLSSQTIKNWISILEASYIVTRVQPYYGNIGKRLVKMPKIYFYDCGLAAYLIGIESPEDLQYHTMRGPLFENLVIAELLKHQFNRGREPQLFFYRDQGGHEVDIFLKRRGKIIPIEVKASETFNLEFIKQLEYVKQHIPEINSGFIVYAGESTQVKELQILNYREINKILN